MPFKRALAVILSALLMSTGAAPATADTFSAEDFEKIEGDYIIAPPEGDTEMEFGLIITGSAAQRIYEQLAAPEAEDLCTGGTRKDHPTGMQCVSFDSEFMCSLGYTLKKGQTTPGPMVC